MSLLEEQLEMDGVVYDCRELPMGEMMPLLEKDGSHIGLALIRVAVSVDGEPLGDAVDEMGFRSGKKLMAIVNRLNGLTDDEEKP